MSPQAKKLFLCCILGSCLSLVQSKTSSSQPESDQPNGSCAVHVDDAPVCLLHKQSAYPRDCLEAVTQSPSANSSGVYQIKPDGYSEAFDVYCDSDGYTFIERREDGLISFDRSWEEYENGFGFLSHEFWLGNEKLSYLTNQKKYELRIDVTLEDGSTFYVTYDSFVISDEYGNYTLMRTGDFKRTVVACPDNMIIGNCTCQKTCADPSNCTSGACHVTGSCFCPDGFLMNQGHCIPRDQSGCFIAEANSGGGIVLKGGQSLVNENCTERQICNGNQLIIDGEYQCGVHAQCRSDDDVRGCYCDEGYEGNGQNCSILYRDCDDVYLAGQRNDGVYTVMPTNWTGKPFNVSCVMSKDGGWTVFQRRTGRDTGIDFYRDWTSYQEGFGSLYLDFWLGNEKLHFLTKQRDYRLRVDIETSRNTSKYDEYASFATASGSDKYRLRVSGYMGNAGNGMKEANGQAFSTYDSDNDNWGSYNCAERHRGAWWYTNRPHEPLTTDYCDRFRDGNYTYRCTFSNLNGDWNGGYGQNIFWHVSRYCNINFAEMKIRPSI